MGQRAESLAKRFEEANSEVIANVEKCSRTGWKAACPDAGWTAGVTAHHLGEDHALIAGMVRAVAEGQTLPPMTMEMINQDNANHALRAANCTKDEVLSLLRTNGAEAAGFVRGLTDEQLDRTAPMPFLGGQAWSAQQLIENILIGHMAMHGAGIAAAATA